MSGSQAAPLIGPEMRAVRRELAGASDQRVLDVLRFVDGLKDRSQADGLLAPLRDRLRAIDVVARGVQKQTHAREAAPLDPS